MTQHTDAQLLASQAPASERAAPRSGIDQVLEGLWNGLTSMKLALVLILVFAAFTLAGTLIIQAQPGQLDDPQSKAMFIANMRPRYGALTDIFDTLQLFNVFESVWLKLIGALLSASLVACTIQRIPGTWRTMKHPHVAVGDAFFEHAPQHESMIFHKSADEVLATTKAIFGRRRYRMITEGDGTVSLYFDRNHWAPWAGLIAHVAVPVIFLGAMVGGRFGYRDTSFILTEGQTAAIPTVAGATIHLNSFVDTWDQATDMPIDYVSDVTVTNADKTTQQSLIRVNTPLRYGAVSFYQAAYGAAVDMTVTDSSGAAVFKGGVPMRYQSNAGNPAGSLPSSSNVAMDVLATTGISDTSVKPGQVFVILYDSAGTNPTAEQAIDQGKPTKVGAYTVTFDKEGKYTQLSVTNDPGMPIVWLGFLLLVAGFGVRMYIPFRRVWARLTPRPGGTSLSLAAVGRRDSSLDAEFTSIVTDIRQALVAQAQS